jgi:O-acetyl-ADP-ribose deacetylase (regulator of RNase III)
MTRVAVQRVDITQLAVDAIVNAANERLLGGGGVDGAIHAAAGPELLRACRELPEVRPGVRCPTGEARVTPGFLLPARLIVHTVGPVWRGGDDNERELLASCYRNVLAACATHRIRTLAIPAISCGIFGFPAREAAQIAAREIAAVVAGGAALDTVLLVSFGQDVHDALREAIQPVVTED